MSTELEKYLTLEAQTRLEIPKIKGSRFIAAAAPAPDRAAAEAFVERQRKEFHNATHHCWAYRLGTAEDARSQDDGEPSGTAGKPILQALEARGLYYAAVVVTRYFGGTKLGTGGLSRAYGEAATTVLDQAPLLVLTLFQHYRLRYAFEQINVVMNVVSKSGARFVDTQYGEDVRAEVALRVATAGDFVKNLTEATASRVVCEEAGQVYD